MASFYYAVRNNIQFINDQAKAARRAGVCVCDVCDNPVHIDMDDELLHMPLVCTSRPKQGVIGTIFDRVSDGFAEPMNKRGNYNERLAEMFLKKSS